jgi:hypothetical protein
MLAYLIVILLAVAFFTLFTTLFYAFYLVPHVAPLQIVNKVSTDFYLYSDCEYGIQATDFTNYTECMVSDYGSRCVAGSSLMVDNYADIPYPMYRSQNELVLDLVGEIANLYNVPSVYRSLIKICTKTRGVKFYLYLGWQNSIYTNIPPSYFYSLALNNGEVGPNKYILRDSYICAFDDTQCYSKYEINDKYIFNGVSNVVYHPRDSTHIALVGDDYEVDKLVYYFFEACMAFIIGLLVMIEIGYQLYKCYKKRQILENQNLENIENCANLSMQSIENKL